MAEGAGFGPMVHSQHSSEKYLRKKNNCREEQKMALRADEYSPTDAEVFRLIDSPVVSNYT